MSEQVVAVPRSTWASTVLRRVPGTRLLGRYEGGGYVDQRYLVMRPDGQPVLLSELPYLVVRHADGGADAHSVAERVSHDYGRRLAGPLLPGWTDDWLLAEIERIQQLRVHALDIWAARLLAVAAYPLALSVAEAAVLADPLRESAHRRLMEVHLAQGNTASALRQYQRFSALLREELGIRPSRLIQAMADRITGPDAPGRLITR